MTNGHFVEAGCRKFDSMSFAVQIIKTSFYILGSLYESRRLSQFELDLDQGEDIMFESL